MQRRIITISSKGAVNVPAKVQMTAFEIAQLLGIYVPTVKAHIKAVLKSEACRSDMSLGGTVVSGVIQPDYFGLDMVIAIAFRVKSYEADIFRRYVMSRIFKPATQPMFITLNSEHKDLFSAKCTNVISSYQQYIFTKLGLRNIKRGVVD